MKAVIKVNNYGNFEVTEDDNVLTDVISSLTRNNTFCPNITKISKDKDIMRVSFADGTWTEVKRNEEDIADDSVAILYSIAKRLMGKPTKGGYVEGCGFMARIRGLVENIITPEKIAAEKEARAKAKAEADRKAHEEAVIRRERNPSIGLRLRNLEDKFNKVLEVLEGCSDSKCSKNTSKDKDSRWFHFHK